MSSAREREQVRERVQRHRERKKEEAEGAIRERFETQPTDFAAQEGFLRECEAAVDLLLECDSFFLWTLHPSAAKSLQIPVPMHIDASNIGDAIGFVGAFADAYERSPWAKLDNRWSLMNRMCLWEGASLRYRVCGCVGPHDRDCAFAEDAVDSIPVHVLVGTRDLYAQYLKRLGRPFTAFSG